MEPIPYETWQSFERSASRKRLALLVNSLGEAYLHQLSRITGIRPQRVLAMIYGKPPSYSIDLGLRTLGLVEDIPTRRGRAWRITTRGRRKCRSWAAARVREGRREVRAGSQPRPSPGASASWSFRWEG